MTVETHVAAIVQGTRRAPVAVATASPEVIVATAGGRPGSVALVSVVTETGPPGSVATGTGSPGRVVTAIGRPGRRARAVGRTGSVRTNASRTASAATGARGASRGDRRDGDRSYGRDRGFDRQQGRPSSDRGQQGDRPYGDRRHGDRRQDDRRQGERPYRERTSGDRPGGERPYRPRRDDERGYGARDDRRGHGGRHTDGPAGPREPRQGGGRVAGRPAQRGFDRGRDRDRAPHERAPREAGHGAAELALRPRHDDPVVADRIQPRDLDRAARSELKTLSKENADWVARHLVAAAEALEDDPALAHRHALSASRRAGRVAVVRETLAITAYATGDFALALRELRTYRRLSGNDDQIALMVDSERGVGRSDRALELGRSVDRSAVPVQVQVALAIAMSGARLDLGQPELALTELEIAQLDPDRAFSYSPALFAAYAEVLEELGRADDAARWRSLTERAEAALEGARPDFIEVFSLEDDEEPVAVDAPAAPPTGSSEPGAEPDGEPTGAEPTEDEPTEDAPSEDSAGAPADSVDAVEESDPADAIEPEVAEILAETAHLDGDQAGAEPA
ncbi:hypothetical protein GCM10025870_04580 [Agromyces marinus]|uniref:Primosomal protein n=1 Tax=Agromyces marinus TaxID=1389020 RepID=A0ABM8GY04_9MICO|nr:primosomal protein [Agromyces marinus]BDZ53385.1 hypothetical protein GCM10025870_04580 [Agromyces marinus]